MGAKLCCQEDLLARCGEKDCTLNLPIIASQSVVSPGDGTGLFFSYKPNVVIHVEETRSPQTKRTAREPEEEMGPDQDPAWQDPEPAFVEQDPASADARRRKGGNAFDMEYFEDEPPSPAPLLPSLLTRRAACGRMAGARGPAALDGDAEALDEGVAEASAAEDTAFPGQEVQTFQLAISRDSIYERLGLEVKHVGTRLEVVSIAPCGAAARANVASVARNPPGQMLACGDLIQSVNGVAGSSMDVAVECEARPDLKFEVVRSVGPRREGSAPPRQRPFVPPLKLPANYGSPHKSRMRAPARGGLTQSSSGGLSPICRRGKVKLYGGGSRP